MKQRSDKSKCRLSRVEVTEDTLTGRGGIAPFARYIEKVGIIGVLVESFGYLRRSNKGAAIASIFKQVLCFFYDGTSRHISYFDHLKKDAGYAAVMESSEAEMVSSHQVKRFFRAFVWLCGGMFRKILKRMFIWQVQIEKPEKIE